MSSSHAVYTFSPALAAKPTSAKPVLAKAAVSPGTKSTQPSLPVQPNDNGVMIVLSVILVAGITLIGLAFSAILGM